jgi:glutamate--cysteine ligase catalytic subunit
MEPSHLYSNRQSNHASSVSGSLGGLLSPPESRRTSGDEKEQRTLARQSLPSIHEALSAEQPLPYPPPLSTPASQSYLPPLPPPSTTSPTGRTFSIDHINGQSQGPPNPFSHAPARSPFLSTPSSAAPPPPPPSAPLESMPRHASFSAPQPNPRLPSLHLRTNQSPPPDSSRTHPTHNPYPSQPPPPYESSAASHSAGSMNYPHGYHYPPTSAYPLSAPLSNSHNPSYPSSPTRFSAPPVPPRYHEWKSDVELGRYEAKKSLAPYGESVKRHLESFDLEASLNEVRIPILLTWLSH